ncbi:MAG: 3-keto-5-aminohexanoate cleavage protein [Gammaproteobacteria bacterium]|nr:3-keto-5-aminohexanoate cleavage protein [Gammaproteobacteria bacterium]
MTDEGKPFIVMSAPNGARRGKTDHSGIPLSPLELAENAQEILDCGASLLHLHVRDESDRHSLDPGHYRAAIDAVRERVGDALVIQVTTEAVGVYSVEQQMSVVKELRPEAVSIALRELVPDRGNTHGASCFFEWLRSNGVMPQYILYSVDEVRWFEEMRGRGMFHDDLPFVLFVLGVYGTTEYGDPANLEDYRRALGDERIPWAVCCFGPREDEVSQCAANTGGHARVGFENNMLMPDGSDAPDNAALVRLAAGHARTAGRQLATADDVRQLIS